MLAGVLQIYLLMLECYKMQVYEETQVYNPHWQFLIYVAERYLFHFQSRLSNA
jgi:hypothetical protein